MESSKPMEVRAEMCQVQTDKSGNKESGTQKTRKVRLLLRKSEEKQEKMQERELSRSGFRILF